jgi:hypothetical protein
MWLLGPKRRLLRDSNTLKLGQSGPARRAFKTSLLTDAVEKGKNELTENFPCEPVETSIWECSGS